MASRRPDTRLVIITNKQDVDVASDAGSIVQHLLHATQQHAQDGLLDVLVAVDAGGQGASQLIKDVLQAGRHRLSAREEDEREGNGFSLTGTESVTLERPELKLRILAMSSADRLGDTSLLICLTVQAIMMVLVEKNAHCLL